MKIRQIAKIAAGQDGAIWDRYLFRFDARGNCHAYNLDDLQAGEISCFALDRRDVLMPHSNAVMFGSEYYQPGDEFPLLYTNIYNNYAKTSNPLKGVCCVYRLQRSGSDFTTTLVQLIEIGFVEDSRYWSSSDEQKDVRPYGNFAIDRDKGIYYAFTMRDHCNSTRYFSFSLPRLRDGALDEEFQVEKVVLSAANIIDFFDCEYHHYLQGACTHSSKIYSLEGFTDDVKNPPALRVISPSAKRQELYVPLSDCGLTIEPEWIDFRGETCYYADNPGNLYVIEF